MRFSLATLLPNLRLTTLRSAGRRSVPALVGPAARLPSAADACTEAIATSTAAAIHAAAGSC
ncbi:MAG: hypothetical protein KDC36_03090 [Thermoleophilia bacterium]|nr:hypothetical protein [Thermoleophilia bacterium]